jgi:hypothetical protein
MTTLLPAVTITAAIASPLVSSVFQIRDPGPSNLGVQCVFTYGSGGTSVDAYLQTSYDDGATWVDIANFHFTTSSGTKIINLSGNTAVTSAVTPTDGSMSSNTAQDGVLGSRFRVKYQSSGTYAGGTTLQVDVHSQARLAPVT